MLKSIARNSLIYYLSEILTKGISFFLLPLYTSVLSTEDYGVIELMSIISTLAIIVFSFQVNRAVARYYHELRGPMIKIYTSTVALFSFSSFSILFLLAFLFKNPIADFLSLNIDNTLWAILSISLNGMFYISQNQLTWKIEPVKQITSGLTYNLITIGLTVFLIVYLDQGVGGIFKAQCAGAVAGIVVGVLFTRSDFGFKFSVRVLKKLFRFAVPLIPGALSIFLYMFTDRICIKEMIGMEALGVYSVGNKIATILSFVTFGFSNALSPVLYKHYKDSDTPEKVAFLFRLFSTVAFVAMSFLAFFAPSLIEFLATPDYAEAAWIIPFLLFAIYLNGLTQFFPGLNFANKTFTISLIAIAAGILNIIFNIILIPFYGIMAASIATFLTYGINFFLLYRYSQKVYPVKVSLRPLFLLSTLYGLLLVISLGLELTLFYSSVLFVISTLLGAGLVLKKKDFRYIREKGLSVLAVR